MLVLYFSWNIYLRVANNQIRISLPLESVRAIQGCRDE